METLTNEQKKALYWAQPKTMKRRYELHAQDGNTQYGMLEFEKAFGSLANAETAEKQWTLKRVGFFKPQITVREAGKEENLLVYTPRWNDSGTIECADGRVFHFKLASFWKSYFQILDENETVLVEFKPTDDRFKLSNILKDQSLVNITDAGYAVDIVLLLAVLGWYLVILQESDAATAATIAAVAVSV